MFASPLAESEEFVSIRFIPNGFVFGVSTELAMFECLTSFMVEHWARDGNGDSCVGSVRTRRIFMASVVPGVRV